MTIEPSVAVYDCIEDAGVPGNFDGRAIELQPADALTGPPDQPLGPFDGPPQSPKALRALSTVACGTPDRLLRQAREGLDAADLDDWLVKPVGASRDADTSDRSCRQPHPNRNH